MGGGGQILTYGPYGGRYVPETLIPALEELEAGWRAALADEAFRAEIDRLGRTYAGRPTPLTRAERFAPGKRLYLKREDLLHTGAHKLNNALGQAELARRLGRRRIVAEARETPADLVQLYPDDGGDVRGREAVLLRDGEPVARHLDQPWEGHDPEHWRAAAAAEGRVMLAGGLGPENVREAIAAVQPWAVDASSSLEREPGVKDHDKVRAWVAAARS